MGGSARPRVFSPHRAFHADPYLLVARRYNQPISILIAGVLYHFGRRDRGYELFQPVRDFYCSGFID